jgi:hypothetical protein
MLNAKVTPRVVVCLCDWESFRFVFTTTMKLTYITKMHFKFGQYMEGVRKDPVSLQGFMKAPIFYYVYLFIRRVGKSV